MYAKYFVDYTFFKFGKDVHEHLKITFKITLSVIDDTNMMY